MERETRRKTNRALTPHVLRLAVILAALIAAVACAFDAGAWFHFSRKAAVAADIDNPLAIYIKAGNKEDVKYIDLSSIDKTNGTTYDVVFSVCGTNVDFYKLQLAFTTNNQFEYEIYPAAKLGSGETAPSGSIIVNYTNHSASPAVETYYSCMPTGSGALNSNPAAFYDGGFIRGHYLNRKSGDEILALASEDENQQGVGGSTSRHEITYKTDSGDYDNVEAHAEPLYWHSDGTIRVHYAGGEERSFCQYFILRVKWAAAVNNNKETDVIYISAKVFSAEEPTSSQEQEGGEG